MIVRAAAEMRRAERSALIVVIELESGKGREAGLIKLLEWSDTVDRSVF